MGSGSVDPSALLDARKNLEVSWKLIEIGAYCLYRCLFGACVIINFCTPIKRVVSCIIIYIINLLIGIFSVHVDIESPFEAILHSKIELKCKVDAIPTPSLMWHRVNMGGAVTKLVHTQDAGDPTYGILERNVTTEDDGKWRCTVSGSYGGKMADFVITVIGTY